MEKENDVFWTYFCDMYSKTKEYYLLIEELDFDFSTIMQPIKEQRDALDHIVRAYQNRANGDQDGYDKELSKAIGHIERAFYDLADILTIVLRDRIRECLCEFSYREIITVWEEYPKWRKYLISINRKIAELRFKKGNKETKQEVIDEYNYIVKKLGQLHDFILIKIYPKLAVSS